MYERFRSQVQTAEGTTEEFQTSSGVLQAYILSPHIFNLFLQCGMLHVEATNGAMIGGIVIDKPAYADTIDKLIGSVADTKADNLEVVTRTFGMKINEDKRKLCAFQGSIDHPHPNKA